MSSPTGDDDPEPRPKLTRRELWALIVASYRTSFPYLLVFVVGLLAATWLLTEVFFR